VSQHLLPPAPCADADEERFLLDAARFLVKQGLASALPSFHDDDDDDDDDVRHRFARNKWEEEDEWYELEEGDEEELEEEMLDDYMWDAYNVRMAADHRGHVDAVGTLADLGFFLDAQLHAAHPGAKTFSFSGRTLASLTRLAAEHQREALVAATVAKMSGDGGICFDTNKLRGLWREPLRVG
jgi:hypothetical protein